MPRPQSAKRQEIKQALLQRINSLLHSPGARFMSDRNVAHEFDISILTAQKILNELAVDGYLDRRPCSGTYIPGETARFKRVHLVFDKKARIRGSFQSEMLRLLKQRLTEERVPWKFTNAETCQGIAKSDYCVVSEHHVSLVSRGLAVTRRRGLMLGSMPSTDPLAKYFDSVSGDDFYAGVLAARLLQARYHCRKVAILAQPPGRMDWGAQCLHGFRAIYPRARTVYLSSFSQRLAPLTMQRLFQHSCDGVLCSFRRLALDLFEYCDEHGFKAPAVVAISMPPVAPDCPIPVIGVPLNDMVESALRIIHNRLLGDPAPAMHLSLKPKVYE